MPRKTGFQLPCEQIVRVVIPSLRGEIVRRLSKNHKMAQKEIAEILGLSQPSISYYINNKRGDHLDILDQYNDKIEEIIKIIVDTKSFPYDQILNIICSICDSIKKSEFLQKTK